ncbi:MAG: 2Fe-2S iron-sulfur cluster binding domain-containing protein, partial [Desulfobacteraceae bacterium]|nr:2Fe-2S iron-sulfur cluster binding domain-containing protein [Desulfobacteraceae bacterium]
MELIINGKPLAINPLPGEMLVDLLRDRLKLTGTKVGCNEAECGSCTVIVDGEAVLACTYPAARAAGREVVTIEGLTGLSHVENVRHEEGENGRANLHPVQQAFIDHGAVQCGFCIPGQIMTAFALLQHNPEPDEEVIRHALKDTLCRCAGYPSILRAVQAAADNMRTGNPIAAPEFSSASPLEVIGKSYIRPDATDKVTGRTKFTDDLQFESMLHARVRRAGIPHGIVKSINVEKARQVPGVVAVLTADDIPGERNHGLVIYDWPVLVGVGERVRTVGDAL